MTEQEQAIWAAATLFSAVEDVTCGSGASHTVVGDGNVENDHIASCVAYGGLLPCEEELFAALLKMPVKDRETAYYLNEVIGWYPHETPEFQMSIATDEEPRS